MSRPRAHETMVKRWLGIAVFIAVSVTCIRLGFWQLDRYRQRKAWNALVDARMSQGPVDLITYRAVDSLEFRHATVGGVFDTTLEVVQLGGAVNGIPATYITTPLVIDSNRAILVERGWVASPATGQVDPAPFRETDSPVVTGILIKVAGDDTPVRRGGVLRVRRVNPENLKDFYEYDLDPLVLRRLDLPEGAPPGIRAMPPLPVHNISHLSYAIQWFSFATIAIIGPLWASGKFKRRPTNPAY